MDGQIEKMPRNKVNRHVKREYFLTSPTESAPTPLAYSAMLMSVAAGGCEIRLKMQGAE